MAGFAIGAGGETARRLVDQILAQPRASIDKQIIDAAIPVNLETNNVERSSNAFGEFRSMINQVESVNRRNGN